MYSLATQQVRATREREETNENIENTLNNIFKKTISTVTLFDYHKDGLQRCYGSGICKLTLITKIEENKITILVYNNIFTYLL